MNTNNCLYCNEALKGRRGKKYCDPHCKSAYHYQVSQSEKATFYQKVDKQLKLNRKILKRHNRGGKATVRRALLNDLGFNPNFFTHFYKTKAGNVYFFVFEYGFMKTVDKDTPKYVLVHWQEYMHKNNKL